MPKPSFPPEVRYKDHFTWSWDTAKRRIKEQIVDPVTNLFSKGRDQPIRDSGVPADVTRVIPHQLRGHGRSMAQQVTSQESQAWDKQLLERAVIPPVQSHLTNLLSTERGQRINELAGKPPIHLGVEGPLGLHVWRPQADSVAINAAQVVSSQDRVQREQPGRDVLRDVMEHELSHAATYGAGSKVALAGEWGRLGFPTDTTELYATLDTLPGFVDRPAGYALRAPNELAAESYRQAFRMSESPNKERTERIIQELEKNEPPGRGRQVAGYYREITGKLLGRR